MKRQVISVPPARAVRVVACALAALIFSIPAAGPAFAQTAGAPAPQAGARQQPAAPEAQVDRARLEVIEELSEALANDLLELSVATRDRDSAKTAEFFPARLNATPFPSRPLPLRQVVKWVSSRNWEMPAAPVASGGGGAQTVRASLPADPKAPAPMAAAAFLRGWSDFLDNFSEIEDARFKVKESSFDAEARAVLGAKVPTAMPGSRGTARVAFYVIGRNRDGQREWARGTVMAVVRAGKGGRFQFEEWKLTAVDSLVATTDIFSEVAVPAGVGASLPAFGTPGNGGFVWHGAAAADFDGDGFIDLFATAPGRNYLYLNDGAGRFRDASEEAGLRVTAEGVAPLVLDYDNDGDPDIFVSAVGQQMLFENRSEPGGRLRFEDVSLEAGVAVPAIGFSAAAGDVNGDGRLDIYVTSYNRYGQVTPDSWFRATNGTPNLLFISQKDGTFREEAAKWGVEDRRWSYAAEFADINGDGRLDLYVANDFGEKAMFVNRGDRFVDEAKERGVLDPGNGMGVSFGDYNNDGLLDIHASNMSSTAGNRILSRIFPTQSAQENVLKKLAAGNNLFENLGGGKFRDVTSEVGGFSGGWAWGGGFIDFDNDGWEDIYTPNGFISGKSMKDT
ncbi:MAG TPA: VCBS repeat-containing protein [Pyrinomonadaceae bacterium]|nr:VCBS repeat-containing protein [Pyrinomonadaceae bacterium]